MSIHLNKPKNQFLKHPCSDLAAIWGLRILLDLNGWKSLSTGYISLTSDGDLLRTIGLGHLEDKKMKKKDFLIELRRRQLACEQSKINTCPKYRKNLNRFRKLLSLSKEETKILSFAVVLHSHSGLTNIANTLDNITPNALISVFSSILDLPGKKIQAALSHKGILARSGILRFSRSKLDKMCGQLDIMDELISLLFSPMSSEMLQQFFHTAQRSKLCPNDYQYIQTDYQLIRRYLQKSSKRGLKGINILLHGTPGTGKTELARTLSEDLGLESFEISTTNLDGEALEGKSRFTAYQLSQQVLAKRENTLIIFDEIEDVFPATDPFFGKIPVEEKRKAWVNQLLEENSVPAIWISNDIEQIDNAYIRRFDFVLKLEAPPRKVRTAMFETYLAGLSVSKQWIQQAAANKNLAPALISRAAKVVATIHDESVSAEQDLEHILGNSLAAMGLSEQLMTQGHTASTPYCLNALNADYDMKQLLQGLKAHPQGRLCLYGPPGTGKTEFGKFIAQQLDQPLLVKRASDILNAYVGGTEKLIATMFKQARHDHSVLLLDEADSFLQNRSKARYSWQISHVNELLTQMEEFEGLFICSTNLVDSLDFASIRRFDVKIKFDYLLPEQAWHLFQQVLKEMQVTVKNKKRWQAELGNLQQITPGDFATVIRKNRLKSAKLNAETLMQGLSLEHSFKPQSQSRGIGFLAEI